MTYLAHVLVTNKIHVRIRSSLFCKSEDFHCAKEKNFNIQQKQNVVVYIHVHRLE